MWSSRYRKFRDNNRYIVFILHQTLTSLHLSSVLSSDHMPPSKLEEKRGGGSTFRYLFTPIEVSGEYCTLWEKCHPILEMGFILFEDLDFPANLSCSYYNFLDQTNRLNWMYLPFCWIKMFKFYSSSEATQHSSPLLASLYLIFIHGPEILFFSRGPTYPN